MVSSKKAVFDVLFVIAYSKWSSSETEIRGSPHGISTGEQGG